MEFITPHLPMKDCLQVNITPLHLGLFTHTLLGLQHYSINSLLYLRIIQDKYVTLYRELITQLCTYVSTIRVLAKGYLQNTLITPAKLPRNFNRKSRKHYKLLTQIYDLVIDRLSLYYDMLLITFGIDKNMSLINSIPNICTTIYTRNP